MQKVNINIKHKIKTPDKYEIAYLVKPIMKNKIQYYEVHWKGYTNEDNTFEQKRSINRRCT